MTFTFEHIFSKTLKCVEPEKRMVEGRYTWAIHRFPIKGGKTPDETFWREHVQKLAENLMSHNALYKLVKDRRRNRSD